MKPQILKGTRDFLPEQVYKRNYIFDIIKSVFQKYGYLPIETPVMEHLSTLTGKYGEEGDKLLFKLLNNGDFLAKANKDALAANDSVGLIPSISKRGLRYDLTVMFIIPSAVATLPHLSVAVNVTVIGPGTQKSTGPAKSCVTLNKWHSSVAT